MSICFYLFSSFFYLKLLLVWVPAGPARSRDWESQLENRTCRDHGQVNYNILYPYYIETTDRSKIILYIPPYSLVTTDHIIFPLHLGLSKLIVPYGFDFWTRKIKWFLVLLNFSGSHLPLPLYYPARSLYASFSIKRDNCFILHEINTFNICSRIFE